MRVLVTGYGGMSGTYIAHALAARGHTVTALQRSSGVRAATKPETLSIIEGDLIDPPPLPGVDAIVHTASSSQRPGAAPPKLSRDNVDAMRRLVSFACESGVSRFVFFSSLSVFGRIDGPSVDEQTPVHDPDAYGLSKADGEAMLAEAAGDLPALALRLPAVIGPGALQRQANWPTRTLRQILEGEEINIFSPDSPFNNAVHLADLAAFIDGILGQDIKDFDVVTLGAGETVTVREAVERLMAGAGLTVPVRAVDNDASSFIVSSDHAKARYGYAPMAAGEMLERFAREETAESL